MSRALAERLRVAARLLRLAEKIDERFPPIVYNPDPDTIRQEWEGPDVRPTSNRRLRKEIFGK